MYVHGTVETEHGVLRQKCSAKSFSLGLATEGSSEEVDQKGRISKFYDRSTTLLASPAQSQQVRQRVGFALEKP